MFNWIKWTSLDSPWNALSKVFRVHLDPVKRSAANSRKITQLTRGRNLSKSICVICRPSVRSDRPALKSERVERFKGYRLMAVSSKYDPNGTKQFNLNQLGRTFWRSDAESFGIEEAANLRQVAISLDGKVQCGRLHEESEVAVQNSLNTFLVGGDEHWRALALHVAPHLLIRFNSRVLKFQNKKKLLLELFMIWKCVHTRKNVMVDPPSSVP